MDNHKLYILHDVDTYLRSIYTRAITTTEDFTGRYLQPALDMWQMKETFQQIKKDIEDIALLYNDNKDVIHKYFITDPQTKHFNFRYQLLESYKSGRKSTNTMDRLFLRTVTDNINNIVGDTVSKSIKYLEADDCIALYATKLESQGHKVIIVSSDKDLQIIEDTINPHNLNYKDKDDYKLFELCLLSDTADSIPKLVAGYGTAKINKLKDNNTPEEFEAKVRAIFKDKGQDINYMIDLLKPLTYDQVEFKDGQVSNIKLKSDKQLKIIKKNY